MRLPLAWWHVVQLELSWCHAESGGRSGALTPPGNYLHILGSLVTAGHIKRAVRFCKNNFAVFTPNSQARAWQMASIVDGKRDRGRNLSGLVPRVKSRHQDV